MEQFQYFKLLKDTLEYSVILFYYLYIPKFNFVNVE